MNQSRTKFHAGLNVSNVAKSAAFYADLFQAEPVKTRDDYSKFETDEIVLSLIQTPSDIDTRFGHFGLRVADEQALRTRFEYLKERGHAILEEGKVECCYALQDKFWVTDPDGYRWEIYQFLEDSQKISEPAKVEDEACCTPSCCS